tara:strand:- start:8087 stop:8590 length:504 start_codon:yes stop_codon:yes gene_type:complete
VSDSQLTLIALGHLPIKSAHGSTVLVGDSLYLLGGKNNEQAFDSITTLTLDDKNQPQTEVIGKLPFTFALGRAALNNNELYLYAGEQNNLPSNKVCKYSITLQKCLDPAIPPIPGTNRVQFTSLHHKSYFYAFAGFNFQVQQGQYVLTDAYAFYFKKIIGKFWRQQL